MRFKFVLPMIAVFMAAACNEPTSSEVVFDGVESNQAEEDYYNDPLFEFETDQPGEEI